MTLTFDVIRGVLSLTRLAVETLVILYSRPRAALGNTG